MWVRITEIHEGDSFYWKRNELIGIKVELQQTYDNHLSIDMKEKGWLGADFRDEDGNAYIFYAVKFIPEADWQQLHKDHILASLGKFDKQPEPIDEELRKDHIRESVR